MSTKPVIDVFAVVFLCSAPLGLIYAEERFGDESIQALYDNASEEHMSGATLYWMPQIDGKTRYQFEIPTEGLRQAAKYQDAAALYYLSSANDTGMNFSNADMVYVRTTPKSLGLDWFKSSRIQSARYSFGFKYSDGNSEVAQTTLSLGYAKIVQQKVLFSARLEAAKISSMQGAFGATFLNDAETVQYAGWFSKSLQNKDYYNLALQSKMYEAWRDVDSSVTLFQSNEGFSLSTAIYKDMGPVKTSLGLVWYELSKDFGVFVGLTFNQKTKNGTQLKLRVERGSENTSLEWLDELKRLRRAELMAHWRYGMRFPRKKPLFTGM